MRLMNSPLASLTTCSVPPVPPCRGPATVVPFVSSHTAWMASTRAPERTRTSASRQTSVRSSENTSPRPGGGVERVEEEPERAVRLRAEGDLGAEEEELPAPHVRLGGGDATLQVLLAPRPPAAQRPRAVEPGDAAHPTRGRVGAQAH